MVEKQNRLELSKRTRTFALRIIRLYSSLPKSNEAQVIGKQCCGPVHRSAPIIVKQISRNQTRISLIRSKVRSRNWRKLFTG